MADSGDGTVTRHNFVGNYGCPYIQIDYIGDGTTMSTVVDMANYPLPIKDKEWYLYYVKDVFGTGGDVPPTHTVAIVDSDGYELFSEEYTATAGKSAAIDLGVFWVCDGGNITVNLTALTAAKLTTVKLFFLV
jgi:hypothetical protein